MTSHDPRSTTSAVLCGLGIVAISASCFTVITRCRRTKAQLERSNHILTTEGEKKDATIRTLQKSLSDVNAEIKNTKSFVSSLTRSSDVLKQRLTDTEHELQQARNQNHILDQQLKAQTAAAKLARDEVGKVSLAHEQTRLLLRTRTEELRAAQVYLDRADQSSGADVISMIDALNAEIFQTAATVAEAFKFGEKKVEESSEAVVAYDHVIEILGPRMTELLKSTLHHDDQILIQAAFQAAMCAYVDWIVTSWYFEGREEEQMLSSLYAIIQESEDQAIAGRWRALTRRYALQAFREAPDSQRQLLSVVMETLVNILIIAGLESATSEVSETMATQFAEHASAVVEHAMQLNRVIGQGITSCEMMPLYLVPETPFDANVMEDTFGSASKDSTENVLCTTDLGLMRMEKKGEKWEKRVLVKPKIILRSGLADTILAEEVH
ncbi:hypothetical protein DFS33DRAFT_1249158 [Desarmillaria ectypa]|nr:hypothetical protein DFS33DRAFT_1249158 [Desarmillaria ectypa]